LVRSSPNEFAANLYTVYRHFPTDMNDMILKCLSRTCCHWVVKEINYRNYPTLLWHPNSPDLNPLDYSVCGILKEKVYKTRITDLSGSMCVMSIFEFHKVV